MLFIVMNECYRSSCVGFLFSCIFDVHHCCESLLCITTVHHDCGSRLCIIDVQDIECLLDQDDILLPEEAPLVQQQSMIISSPGQQQEQKQVEVKAEGRAQTDSRAAGSSSEPHSHALIPAEQQQFPDAPFPPIMVADFAPMEDSRAQGGCKVLLCLAQEIPPFLLNQQLNVRSL